MTDIDKQVEEVMGLVGKYGTAVHENSTGNPSHFTLAHAETSAYDAVRTKLRTLLGAQSGEQAGASTKWIERWHGSGGKESHEGWSIVDANTRELVAYLGSGVESDAVSEIVMTHNASIAASQANGEAV